MSVFFALSGWCIAQRLQTAVLHGESASLFLLERGLRIFPTYWAALLVTLTIRLAATAWRHGPGLADLPSGLVAWFGDVLLVQPYLGTSAYVMVSWSLVYELGFYLLAACALAAHRWNVRGAWLLVLGGLLCLWPLVHWRPTALLVLGRWPDFFAGVVAWRAARDGRRIAVIAGFGALLLLLWMHPLGITDPIGLTAVVTAALLLSASFGGLKLPRALGPLAHVGAYSYSLYLIHVTFMSPFMNLTGRTVTSHSTGFLLVWFAAVALAVAGGWALHHGCEAPVERWRKNLFAPVRPARAASI